VPALARRLDINNEITDYASFDPHWAQNAPVPAGMPHCGQKRPAAGWAG